MKKKIIGLLVCMLFIAAAVLPVTGNIYENETIEKNNDDYNNLMSQVIENGVISNNDWNEQDKLLASDGAEYDYFGGSVSIDGDYALIGAWGDSDLGPSSGSVYIFKRLGTTWTEQDKLLPSDGGVGDEFGYSVSIDGDYALIGALGDDDNGENSGSAYIFKRDGNIWTEQAKLLASDGAEGDVFGYSVSIDNDYAIIGASRDDDNGFHSGSAYIFKRSGTTWTEQDKLLPSDGVAWDEFGMSVSIDNDYAIIGAWFDDDNGKHSGSAYIFKRDGNIWTEQAKLLASDGAEYDYFGGSVSIDEDYALIGAWANSDLGSSSGSAYIFKRSGTTWTEQDKLLPSDGVAWDEFGKSVSIDGDYALIGAVGDDDNGEVSGSAYVFTRSDTTWTEQDKLLASDGGVCDYFGFSVSLYGDYAIIGAVYDDGNGEDSGSAYIFTRESDNQPPDIPTITGETNGNAGTEYEYTFNTVDPDGDNVKYHIDWDDGDTETTDFFSSGTDVKVKHTWTNEDTYIIRVTAEDTNGLVGPEGTLSVSMPRNKAINTPFLNFLENHPILYQLLQRFLRL